MADLILSELREHVETDLVDAALTRVMADAQAEVDEHFGAVGAFEETFHYEVHERPAAIHLAWPAGSITQVDETMVGMITGEVTTVLSANDYQTHNGGRILERLATGDNQRSEWGDRVKIAYVPVDQSNRRKMVVVDLVKLTLQYNGATSERLGDFSVTTGNYATERNRILRRLVRRGAA